MIRTCVICGTNSSISEFYKGVTNRCKECHKKKVRDNRRAKKAYYRKYDAARYQADPRVKERHRMYQQTEAGKKSMRAANAKWIAANQEKRAAHVLLGNAVKSGRVSKPCKCQLCGAENTRIHGHHDDYAKPLEVKWVCQKRHVLIHRRMEGVSHEN